MKFFKKLFLGYLKWAAKVQLRKIRPAHIVGITGSAGKSSCRDAVVAILKDKYKVKAGEKSLNSEVGVPLDVLGFTGTYTNLSWFLFKVGLSIPFKLLFDWPKYDVYVCELGVDQPKDMDYLLRIVQPDVGVFLNALPVHTANFVSSIKNPVSNNELETALVAEIAKEKGKVITSLPAGGTAVLNADDANVASFWGKAESGKRKVITFGKKGEVKPLEVELPQYALTDDYQMTFAAAAAVALSMGIAEEEAKRLLKKNFKLPPGRGTIFEGINGSLIIDSTYNASPVPTISALRDLGTRGKGKGQRTIAVLGDMRELGELARKEHEKVAAEALKNADVIFTFGPLTEEYFPENKKISKFRTMTDLIDAVKNVVQKNDIVLVKGSQNTIMLETLVEAILANPSDSSKLCRRGEFWEKKRRLLRSEDFGA